MRLVVRRGSVESARENLNEGGAKIEIVPVPVRSPRTSPVSMTRLTSERYWYSSCFAVSASDGMVNVFEFSFALSQVMCVSVTDSYYY